MSGLTERQLQIIDAAIELISEKSIQELTIKNLSRKIGLTEGALYRHFASKTDILLSILHLFQQEVALLLNRICSSSEPATQLIEDIFLHHFEYFIEKPAVSAVIFSESIFQNDTRLAKEVYKLLQMHEDALHCIIEKGQASGEIKKTIHKKELSRIIIGSIRYTVTTWRLSNFKFDLIKEGKQIVKAIKTLLNP